MEGNGLADKLDMIACKRASGERKQYHDLGMCYSQQCHCQF